MHKHKSARLMIRIGFLQLNQNFFCPINAFFTFCIKLISIQNCEVPELVCDKLNSIQIHLPQQIKLKQTQHIGTVKENCDQIPVHCFIIIEGYNKYTQQSPTAGYPSKETSDHNQQQPNKATQKLLVHCLPQYS